MFARGSKLCAAAMLLLAPAIEEVAAFRCDGPRSTADVLASVAAEDEDRLLELAVSGRRGLKGLRDEAARCAHARRPEHDATTTSTSRSIPAAVRRALEARDPHCCVPGCDQTKGLEIDHIRPYANHGPTTLDNLARLCRGHHRMKTIYGWQITGPPGTRQWLPPSNRPHATE